MRKAELEKITQETKKLTEETMVIAEKARQLELANKYSQPLPLATVNIENTALFDELSKKRGTKEAIGTTLAFIQWSNISLVEAKLQTVESHQSK